MRLRRADISADDRLRRVEQRGQRRRTATWADYLASVMDDPMRIADSRMEATAGRLADRRRQLLSRLST